MTIRIGSIVLYRPPFGAGYVEDHGDYHQAAIVTMTPEEFASQLEGTDGTVYPTRVTRPDKGHVHLFLFPIAGLKPEDAIGSTNYPQDFPHLWSTYLAANIPVGEGPGTCSAVPHSGALHP